MQGYALKLEEIVGGGLQRGHLSKYPSPYGGAFIFTQGSWNGNIFGEFLLLPDLLPCFLHRTIFCLDNCRPITNLGNLYNPRCGL